MSLQIWLPLTKDLRQQGLSNTTVINNGVTYSSTDGKLGGNYTSTATNQTITVNFSNLSTALANGKTYSLSCWVKPTGTPDNGWVIKLGNNNCGLWWAKSEARWVWNENDNGKRCANPTISGDYTNWHHLAIVVDKTVSGKITTKQYVDGALAANYPGSTWDCSSHSQPSGTTITISPYVSQLNDIRLYDHCLSPMEVKELAKGLVLHYPLNRQGWGQENLLIDTTYEKADASIANSSTDWTKYFRRYNGSANIHSFLNGEDTITLNSASNLGICFVRKATDINLDSSSYYTLSCEAKSTQTAKQMCIGLSYYNNSNSWVWRGGSNGQSFITPNKWQKFTLTFKPDADTQYICYCFTVVGVANGTDTWTIRNCKLEKDSIATPWCPNSSDELATTMGLNSTTEYDCSGFCNNGDKTGTFTYTSDTPKYSVSTTLTNNTTKIHISNFTTTGFANSYTFAWWGKTSTFSGVMQWGFSDGIRLNGIYNGILWNTGNGSENPLYNPGTTTQVSAPTTNVWHHFAMVGDGSTCKVYKDGVLWAQAKTYKAISGTSIYINGWTSATNYSHSAGFSMSDFRVYATALSADDVKSLYQNSAYIDSSGNVYGAVHEEV